MMLALGLRHLAFGIAFVAASAGTALAQHVCWFHFDGNATGASSVVSVNLNGTVLVDVAIPAGTTDDAARNLVLARIRENCAFDAEPVGQTSLYVASATGASLETCEVSTNDPTLTVADALITPPAMAIDFDFRSVSGGTVPDDVGTAGAGTLIVRVNGMDVSTPYTAGTSDRNLARDVFTSLDDAHASSWWSGASVVVMHDPNGLPVGSGSVRQTPGDDAALAVGVAFPIFIGTVVPSAGCCQAGDTVTIQCTGLIGPATVRFGGVASASVTPSPGQLACVAPNGLCNGAAVDITISTGPLQSATRCGAFTYLDCTRIDSLNPTSGPAAGNTGVTIHGAKFSGLPIVRFGGTNASNVQFVDANTLTCNTPAGSGTVSVSVIAPQGTATVANAFQYISSGSSIPLAGPGALALLVAAIGGLAAWMLRRRG